MTHEALQEFIGEVTAQRDQLTEALPHLQRAWALLSGAQADGLSAPARPKSSAGSGTAKLVLGSVRSGADTVPAIAKDCRLAAGVVRSALKALTKDGHVRRTGKSRATRYALAR